MRLGRPIRLVVGILNCLPFAYGAFFIAWSSSMAFRNDHQPADMDKFHRQFNMIFSLHLATIVLIMALIAFHIVYLFKTNRVPKDKKALWAAVIFLGNMVAIPVFWYLYVRKVDDPSDNDTSNQAL
jgi:uncharacterized BrkB/YihY/UPF0761 family membrane protein